VQWCDEAIKIHPEIQTLIDLIEQYRKIEAEIFKKMDEYERSCTTPQREQDMADQAAAGCFNRFSRSNHLGQLRQLQKSRTPRTQPSNFTRNAAMPYVYPTLPKAEQATYTALPAYNLLPAATPLMPLYFRYTKLK